MIIMFATRWDVSMAHNTLDGIKALICRLSSFSSTIVFIWLHNIIAFPTKCIGSSCIRKSRVSPYVLEPTTKRTSSNVCQLLSSCLVCRFEDGSLVAYDIIAKFRYGCFSVLLWFHVYTLWANELCSYWAPLFHCS